MWNGRGRRPTDAYARVMARTRLDESGCLIFLGRKTLGYGTVRVGNLADGTRRMMKAHRVVYEHFHGPIPDDMKVLHRCDNPPCVNEAHLFIGSQSDNIADMDAKRRRGRSRSPGDSNGSRTHPEAVPRGEDHWKARFTVEQVIAVKAALRAGERQKDIGARFGVGQSHISLIKRGVIWKHV